MTEVRVFDTYEIVPSALPVDLSTTTQIVILRKAVPVLPGDVLDISAEFQVTNDVGRDPAKGLRRFTVGVGYRLMWYDASAASGAVRDATWRQLKAPQGMNVTPDGHHLVLAMSRVLTVPADWPTDHQVGIALRADAHSTAWALNGGGESLTVDKQGSLIVRRYREDFPVEEVA